MNGRSQNFQLKHVFVFLTVKKNLKRRLKIEQSRYELNTIFNLKMGNEFDFLRTSVWYDFYEHFIKEKTFIYYSDCSSAYYCLVYHERVLFSTASGVLREKWEVCCFNFFFRWAFLEAFSATR